MKLSRRQIEVLQLLIRGLPDKQIAGELRLSISMVRKHLHAAAGKLSAAGRVGLAIAFYRRQNHGGTFNTFRPARKRARIWP
ncbi:MAG: LuxR C-terminal-related transcriptional regulator [Verrucomicrobiota bacterium]